MPLAGSTAEAAVTLVIEEPSIGGDPKPDGARAMREAGSAAEPLVAIGRRGESLSFSSLTCTYSRTSVRVRRGVDSWVEIRFQAQA